MKKITLLFLLIPLFCSCSSNTSWLITSPDENISLYVELDAAGSMMYSASMILNEELVTALETSILGLDREDGSFSIGLKLSSEPQLESIKDHYRLVSGKKKDISYEANQLTVALENMDGAPIEMIFRVSNDGIAYRYHFPNESPEPHTIIKEYSDFNLPDQGKVWTQAYDTITQYTPAYETYWVNGIDIGTPAPSNKNGWSFPSTFNTNGLWIMIMESNLDGTYPASHLEADCENGIYKLRFPETGECFGEHSEKPVSTLPWYSPWRLAVIGDNPGTVLESTLVTDLADPSRIENTSWIKPGRAAWSWWSDSPSPRYVREQNKFTDLAAEMGWEYNLIDANWNDMIDGKVEDAISYANNKGIGAWLWYNSGGAHNIVTEQPRDKMWDPEIREKEFQWLAELGVKGIKVDFFQSDKQAIINQYIGILEDGAEHHVMLNFHGCTMPRGWQRTWPNMMTLEAVAGSEVYKFGAQYAAAAPVLNTILPFTRNAVGPMDYTPVTFSDHTYPHLTTYAHELALSVIFESGIIHMADKVEIYQNLPGYARKFLEMIPADWDETRYIEGTPGDYVVLARRNGDQWYIGGISGRSEPLSLNLKMDFLDEGEYELVSIADGKHDQEFINQLIKISPGGKLGLDMLPYGGFAGLIREK